jgi:hypothetical protein
MFPILPTFHYGKVLVVTQPWSSLSLESADKWATETEPVFNPIGFLRCPPPNRRQVFLVVASNQRDTIDLSCRSSSPGTCPLHHHTTPTLRAPPRPRALLPRGCASLGT